MALSEIIINDLVQSQINTAINESDYQLLRQYLLERLPLSSTINSISTYLSEQCNTDKQAMLNQVIPLACESQKKEDTEEADKDKQESDDDNALKAHYLNEFNNLTAQLHQLESDCFQRQANIKQASNKLYALQVNLTQVNSDMYSLDRQSLHSSYPQKHVHSHYSHTQVYPHINPDNHLLQNALNRLINEYKTLTYLISTTNNIITEENQILNKSRQEKKQIEEHLVTMKHQIEIELPHKEEQRALRNQERINRDNARKAYDPNLLQLSPKNFAALKQKIEIKGQKLDNKQKQLMDTALELSYPMYLTQLEHALQQTTYSLQMTFNEKQALKLILGMMKNFMEMSKKENIIINSLNETRTNLYALQKELEENTLKLQHHATTEPKRVQANKELTDATTQLQLESKSAGHYRKNALYAALFGTACGLLSAGLINTLIISPLFFAVPGAFAMLGVISLTIAIIVHFQKAAHDVQIEQNNQQIHNNEKALMNQWKSAYDLSVIIIPNLKMQISQTENQSAQIEQQLLEQQNAMSQLFNKAQNVSSNNGESYIFFKSTEEKMSPFPSAPSMDDEIQDQPPSYGSF